MTHQALIIAAGFGSRLQRHDGDIPKPLRKVGGMPLIKRAILCGKEAGIREFVIVVGFQKEKIIQALDEKKLGVKLTFVENPEWEKPNGVSVLKAKPHLLENFVLLMSDHIFEPRTLAKLIKAPLWENKAILAVDTKLESIFDMDDATKVVVEKDQIKEIGKELKNYNAVDTGMFLCSQEVFTVLEETSKTKAPSLSNGIRLLAKRNQMGSMDVGNAFWQDVDTKGSLKHAERFLLNSCRKPTDGLISRNFNRYISLFITKYLLKTSLSANTVTFLTTLVGVTSGILVAQGTYLPLIVGAFLFKLSSILDGCDGEMSRITMTSSKLGQWLDTASDNFTYVCFFIGAVVGLFNQGHPHALLLGSLALLGVGMTLLVMFTYLIKHTDSGSLLAIQKDFQQNQTTSPFKKFFQSVSFMTKRDFFSVTFLFMALVNRLDWIVLSTILGAHAMWMVLISNRLGLFKASNQELIKVHSLKE